MPTIVYVDGFNLYYGSLKGTPYKWLDLEKLASVLLPTDDIALIRYFTARITSRPDDPAQAQRQQAYLRALNTLPRVSIHLGQYRTRIARMPLAHPSANGPRTAEVLKTEEKGSDVNLATHLLLDVADGSCTNALVVTNDSDLAGTIRAVRLRFPVRVGIANPHAPNRRSRELRGDYFRQLRTSALAASQLPPRLVDVHGTIRRPPGW